MPPVVASTPGSAATGRRVNRGAPNDVRSTPKTLTGTDISNMDARSNITTAMVALSRVTGSSEHRGLEWRDPHPTTPLCPILVLSSSNRQGRLYEQRPPVGVERPELIDTWPSRVSRR